jgi:ATP-binding cassette subfamily B protein
MLKPGPGTFERPAPNIKLILSGLRSAAPKWHDASDWAFFKRFYQPHAIKFGIYVVLAVSQSLLLLPVLYLIHYVFDQAIPRSDEMGLMLAGLGILLTRGASSVMAIFIRMRVVELAKGIVSGIRTELVALFYRLSLEFHSEADVGRLQARMVQDTERLEVATTVIFSTVLPAVLSAIIIVLALIVLQPSIVLILIAISPIIWLTVRSMGRRVRQSVAIFQASFEDFSRGVLFMLRQMDLTRVTAQEPKEQARQQRNIKNLLKSSRDMNLSFAVHGHVQQNLTGVFGVVILIVGAANVANGSMTIGELVAFYAASSFLNNSTNIVWNGFADYASAMEATQALRTLFESGPLEPVGGHRKLDFKGHISFSQVAFDYRQKSVLRDVSLDLHPGSIVAVVGENGSGKSTILNIALGFLHPQSGQVCADRVPYDEIDLGYLRRQFGVVRQGSSLFRGTILENITYGHPDASIEDVLASTRLTHVDEFICALPDGYDTLVGEGGQLLSGGERQRIALARALLGRPKTLILDEPTNHLDEDALKNLLELLRNIPGRPSILLVTHDDRAVKFSDKVYRLDSGTLNPVQGSIGSEGASSELHTPA